MSCPQSPKVSTPDYPIPVRYFLKVGKKGKTADASITLMSISVIELFVNTIVLFVTWVTFGCDKK